MKRKTLIITSILLICSFFVLINYLFWILPTKNTTSDKILDLVKIQIQALAYFFGLVAIIIAGWRAYSADKTAKIQADSNITDRFTKAIEQLGNDKFEIRIGGIYALERIAKDSERDHWAIMQILATYVRENSPYQNESKQATKDHNLVHDKENHQKKPAEDIQSILNVFRHRNTKFDQGKVDLSATNLLGSFLFKANLYGAYLYKTNLERANLQKTYFESANFESANFEKANLYRANLYSANLNRANLDGAILYGTNFEKANLQGTSLQGANFEGAYFSKVKGLKYDQLTKVKTLYRTKNIPKDLEEKLKSEHPHLFVKPKE